MQVQRDKKEKNYLTLVDHNVLFDEKLYGRGS